MQEIISERIIEEILGITVSQEMEETGRVVKHVLWESAMLHSEADRSVLTDSWRKWGGDPGRPERVDCVTQQPVDVVNIIPQERVRWHTGEGDGGYMVRESNNMSMVKQARGPAARVAKETVQDNDEENRGKTKCGTEPRCCGSSEKSYSAKGQCFR